MKVAVSKFACEGIKAQLGGAIPVGVRIALFHYASKVKTGRKPTPFPRFLADRGPAEPEMAFDLIVDPETETVLEREAARQGTTLERLVTHAILVYLAEARVSRCGAARAARRRPLGDGGGQDLVDAAHRDRPAVVGQRLLEGLEAEHDLQPQP